VACFLDAVSVAIVKFTLQVPISYLELHQSPHHQDTAKDKSVAWKAAVRKASHRAASKELVYSTASSNAISLSVTNTLFLPLVFWKSYPESGDDVKIG